MHDGKDDNGGPSTLAPAELPHASDAPAGNAYSAEAPDPLVGKNAGEYVIRRRLGVGGMGLVYEGEQPLIGRRVAIKMLRPELTANPEQLRTLLDEARSTNAVRHRGIIDIFGFGELPGHGQYMVMEYLEGEPLDLVIQKRAPMLAADAIPILDETLAALSAAHAVGVIHRDLKPSNIFRVHESSGSSYVKVLDFGLAKQAQAPHGLARQTRASVMVGTPEYMAPEQACGQTVGPMSDLYAVGVIAFEMLTGRLPFEGENPVQIAVQQVNNPPPSPSDFVAIHPELDRLILDLLEKDITRRPGSAEQVRQRLRRISLQLANESTQVKAAPRKPKPPAPPPQASNSDTLTAPNPAKPTAPSVVLSPSFETQTRPQPRPTPEPKAAPDTETDRASVGRKLPVPLIAGAAAVVLVAAVGIGFALRGNSGPAVAPLPKEVVAELLAPLPETPKKAPEKETPRVEPVIAKPPADEPKPPVDQKVEEQVAADQKLPVDQKAEEKKEPAKKQVRLASAKKAPSLSGKTGKVRFTIGRYAELYVDGALRGGMPSASFPMNTIELAAGSHEIEFRNVNAMVRYRTRVVVPPDGTANLQVVWESYKP